MNQTTVSVTKCLCVVYAFWKWLRNENGSTKSTGSQYEATNVSFHLIFSETWNDQGHFHHRPWGSARQANTRMAWHRQRLELKIVSSSFQFYQAPLGSLKGLGCMGSESLVASQQETMLWIWGFPILTSHIFPFGYGINHPSGLGSPFLLWSTAMSAFATSAFAENAEVEPCVSVNQSPAVNPQTWTTKCHRLQRTTERMSY